MTVKSLGEAERLHLEYKREWTARIRWRIVECLVDRGRFHAEDLLDLEIPEDCDKLPGTCIGAASRQGLMVRGTEFYATGAPGGHGRKSFEWLITDLGREVLTAKLAAHRQRLAAVVVPDSSPESEPVGTTDMLPADLIDRAVRAAAEWTCWYNGWSGFDALDAESQANHLDLARGPAEAAVEAVAPLLVAHGEARERARWETRIEAAEALAVAAEWAGHNIAYAAPELIAEKAVEGIQRLQEPLAAYIALTEGEEA